MPNTSDNMSEGFLFSLKVPMMYLHGFDELSDRQIVYFPLFLPDVINILFLSFLFTLVIVSTVDQHFFQLGAGLENRILNGWTLIFLWFNILSFLRPYNWSGPLIRMIVQIVADMRMFVVVLILLLLGFVGAFAVLQPHNAEVRGTKAFFFVFQMMLGEFDMQNFKSKIPS